ncbi:hypothetical protein ALTERO38_50443 [Alteromonas sp. 38]|nr:hypothetical protein ALTER154_80826 [Alteromonas sp. 154]VXB33317.1 hypothetical protein ALTERO38_50443 [Alteromonas sp. 38]
MLYIFYSFTFFRLPIALCVIRVLYENDFILFTTVVFSLIGFAIPIYRMSCFEISVGIFHFTLAAYL